MALDFVVLGSSGGVAAYQSNNPDVVIERHIVRRVHRTFKGEEKYIEFEYKPGLRLRIDGDDLQKFNVAYAACEKSKYVPFVHKDIIIFKRNDQPVAIAMQPVVSLTRGSHLGGVPTRKVYAGRKRN